MRGRGERTRAALARGLVWAPVIIVLAVSLYYLNSSIRHLQSTISDPKGVAVFTIADSKHYLEIAEAFTDGEFTGYLHGRPHRQPLYPALLAIAELIGGGRQLFLLGMVNVLIGLATIWLVFLLASRLFSSPIIGALTALLYARNDFAFDYITDRIMTEPLYALCSFTALALTQIFVEHGRARSLYLAFFAVGLAYLTRPNGFILMAAMLGVLLLHEVLLLARGRGWRHPDPRRLRAIAVRYSIACLIFVATTVPSWVPRLALFGNPLHHGVVSNSMWVDTWEELREHKKDRLGPSYYFATHGLSDVIDRLVFGLDLVFITAPQELTPKMHLLAVAGIVVAAVRRRRRDLVLAGIMVITLLPIAWTSLSMPFLRIAYGAQLAFILLFSAVLLEFARDMIAHAMRRFGAGGGPGALSAH